MLTKKILIVEDEIKIAHLLADYCHNEGYVTHIIDNGKEVIGLVDRILPDAILLDVMLPYKDGLTLCKEIRTFSTVPIIMLTARVDEIDKLMGLGLGADDYICKPFLPREVIARLNSIFRRIAYLTEKNSKEQDVMQYKNLLVEPEKFSCKIYGNDIELTPVEFRILIAMITRPGVVFSRDQLMQASYDDGRIVSDRTIDTHIKNLRKKLHEHNDKTNLIHSIYSLGYKLE